MPQPKTLGELTRSGWRSRPVKDELRANLLARLREGKAVFPGIVGYDRTVLPQLENAILSRHDFLLLGLRGQAKSRLLRGLTALLDEAIPVVDGCELHDDPTAPICASCQRRAAAEGDALPVAWLPRTARYHEKLATPDVTVADLIGDLDPIKAATRRLTFADPEVMHFGLVPRTHRGILAINELPDLPARIQVALLDILEEGDVQIRGFPIRLPLDLLMVFSANPEDYTNRGSIITPLRDRIASQIVTHYPRTRDESRAITDQEAWTTREGPRVTWPDFLRETVEEVAFRARASALVDQGSGVSARVPIALLENVISNAERRAIRTGAPTVVARVADLYVAGAAVTGKLELVYEGEREGPAAVSTRLIGEAVKAIFDARCPDAYRETAAPAGPPARAEGIKPGRPAPPPPRPADAPAGADPYSAVLRWFQQGHTVDVSDTLAEADLLARLEAIPGLGALADLHLRPAGPGARAAAMEFVLEGLHQSARLAKELLVGGHVYRDLLEEMARGLRE